jgi:hypothetical protein
MGVTIGVGPVVARSRYVAAGLVPGRADGDPTVKRKRLARPRPYSYHSGALR